MMDVIVVYSLFLFTVRLNAPTVTMNWFRWRLKEMFQILFGNIIIEDQKNLFELVKLCTNKTY